MARKEIRQQFAAIPSLIKNRKVPLWNWFAGLCGAMVVFSEGASASALGVATFQTALISALLLSGLLCDRFGIGVDEKKYFTPYRIIGHKAYFHQQGFSRLCYLYETRVNRTSVP